MPEATRRLLYQLNRRWIFGKIVSSLPFYSLALFGRYHAHGCAH